MRASQKAIGKMNVEKGKANGAAKHLEKKRFLTFFKEVKGELKKVEWTSKEELRAYVKIVLISTFCFAMVVYGIDLVIQTSLGIIGKIFG